MCAGDKSLASEIERRLLGVIPENKFIPHKIVILYSRGEGVSKAVEVVGGPMNYIRTKYLDLYKLCIEHGIPIPKNRWFDKKSDDFLYKI